MEITLPLHIIQELNMLHPAEFDEIMHLLYRFRHMSTEEFLSVDRADLAFYRYIALDIYKYLADRIKNEPDVQEPAPRAVQETAPNMEPADVIAHQHDFTPSVDIDYYPLNDLLLYKPAATLFKQPEQTIPAHIIMNRASPRVIPSLPACFRMLSAVRPPQRAP